MFVRLTLAVATFLFASPTFAADLVKRAEASPRKLSDGTVMSRVEKDKAGHVTRLVLDELQLSQEDFAEFSKLEHLRRASFYRTNLTDADLKHLASCRNLEGLNLTGTEVTDAAVDSLLQHKQLKSVCLGDVRISPAAIARLKEETAKRGRRLSLGYAQRKP